MNSDLTNNSRAMTPPNSLEAEQAVLGMLMLSPDAMDEVCSELAENDFYTARHRAIFRSMQELNRRGQPCDAITLGDWFETAGITDITGGIQYAVDLASSVPSVVNVKAYVSIVRQKSTLRQIIDEARSMIQAAYSADVDGSKLVDSGISAFMSMQRVEAIHEFTLRQAMGQAFAAAQEASRASGSIPGVRSGLSEIDRLLGGWHDSDLVIIGARPAMGKTALLLNFAVSCGLPCGIISAEQPAQQVGARIMSISSGVQADKMRNGRFDEEDLGRLERGMSRALENQVLIYDQSSPTIADVSRIARKWVHHSGIKVLFVDYVQRIESSSANSRTPKHERVGEVVKGLKNLARDLNIPIVALAQVGRHVDSREDKQPGMSDISDSSEIEKEADQVLTLFRPAVHDDSADESLAVISVAKNRHGPIGDVCVNWEAPSMRFGDRDYGRR